MVARGFGKANTTHTRLIAFVAEEARQLTIRGCVRPEERYETPLKPLWDILNKDLPYKERTFGMDRQTSELYLDAKHYMKMLSDLYDPKEGD